MKRAPKTPIYRIAKWKETFEKSDARRLKSLPWISVPTDLGSNGYMAMVEEFEDESPAVYGAWIALCAYAAGCDERGVLATSKGDAIPLGRVAKRTGFPVSVFDKLIAWASSPEIAWIEIEYRSGASRKKPETVSEDEREDSDLPLDTPGEFTDYGQDGRTLHYEHNGRTDGETDESEQEPKTAVESPDRPPVRFLEVDENWDQIEEYAKHLHERVDPAKRKMIPLDRKHCLQFAAIQAGYPELAPHLEDVAQRIGERIRRNKPPDRPWGWVRAELIRVCNQFGPGFDAMIAAIGRRRAVAVGEESEGTGETAESEALGSHEQAANAPP